MSIMHFLNLKLTIFTTNKHHYTHPRAGSKAIARGSSKFSLMRTFLDDPFNRLTSIRSVPVSVQYKFRATQSTASPSGCLI